MTHYYRVIKVSGQIFCVEVFDEMKEGTFFPQVLIVSSNGHYHLFEFYIPCRIGMQWESLALYHLFYNQHSEPVIMELREYTKLIRNNHREIACATRRLRHLHRN